MMHRRQIIYASRLHWFATLFVVAAPFVYLLAFTRMAEITTVTLGEDVLVSLARLMAAYVISVVLGWTIAVAFYRGAWSSIILPALDVLQSFPTFALLPLAVFLIGPSNMTIVLFLVLTIIWPIIFTIISSLKLTKYEWHEVATIYDLRGFRYFRYFLWPASLPSLITGTIIGLGEGWEALIATEIIIKSQNGLGHFFDSFAHNAAITGFGVIGFLVLVFSINHLVWLPLLEWSHRQMEE